jgi:hypothetical protein
LNLDISKSDAGNGKAPDPGAAPSGAGRGLAEIQPVPVGQRRPGVRFGPPVGTGGRPPKNRPLEVAPGPPPEQFKPEDVLPVVELPFKLAGVVLRSDTVDLQEDEKARLGRTGANAANYWVQVSPKSFTGIIFLTTLTQVLLAKVILFKAEQRDRAEKNNAVPAAPG